MARATTVTGLFLAVFALALFAGCGDGSGGGGGASSQLLKALPQETNFCVRIRPAAILASAAGAEFDLKAMMQSQNMELPVEPGQIAEIMIGGFAAVEEGQKDQDPVILVTFTQAMDEAALVEKAKASKREEQTAGRTVYRWEGLQAAFISPTELLLADRQADLEAALTRLGGEAGPNAHVRQFGALGQPLAVLATGVKMELPGQEEKVPVQRFQLTGSFSDSVALDLEAELEAERAAQVVQDLQKQLEEFRPQAGPMLQGMLQLEATPTIEALDNLQIAASGGTVTASATITPADLDLLKTILDRMMGGEEDLPVR